MCLNLVSAYIRTTKYLVVQEILLTSNDRAVGPAAVMLHLLPQGVFRLVLAQILEGA